jgi:LmbE family N-acetylglucosaminyl deacetylase
MDFIMTDSESLRGVLYIGAHPDDETIMAGGTLAMLHEHDIPAFIICATDGRGGEAGGIPEAEESREALARLRAEEFRCATAALGATSATILGYEDPIIGPGDELFGFAADDDTLVQQIARHITEKAVDVVLTHGSDGEYGHPAHIQVHRAVLRAVREIVQDVLLYTTSARLPGIEDHILNQSDPAHLALDITPWSEAKYEAMLCHRTQHVLFKRRRKLETVRQAIRYTESYHRCWPQLTNSDLPDDPFAALLLAAGAWVPDRS